MTSVCCVHWKCHYLWGRGRVEERGKKNKSDNSFYHCAKYFGIECIEF